VEDYFLVLFDIVKYFKISWNISKRIPKSQLTFWP